MELHDYQKRCANFCALHKNAILSVDMGLGKTAAVLAFLEWKRPASLLIVAPKRVAENNWKQEAGKWGFDHCARNMIICAGMKAKRQAAIDDTEHPYKIISRDNVKAVAGRRFDIVVVDELTSFKNIASERTKALLTIKAAQKIGLTGTFLANGAIDIYAQAAAVGLTFGNLNFWAWRATYFRDALAGSGLQFQKWKLQTPLETLLKPIAGNIFTLTAEDYLHIPPVTQTPIYVNLDAKLRKAYNDLKAFLSFELGDEILTFDEGAKFAKLQTLLNGFVYDSDGNTHRGDRSAKLEAVADKIEECYESGEPVLCFYAYRSELEWLEEMLRKKDIKFDNVKNAGFMQRWNNHETPVLFAHPASAGHGLNLQHGGRVIVWSSLTYNYELFAQANARLARQGQKNNVQIYYFFVSDTIEESIWQALTKKQEEQTEFLDLTKQ